ncbi:MAG: GFA family protein [Thiotrichales bacterium]|nr:MAG: GFA family protein [Thiotrichales bacterium]
MLKLEGSCYCKAVTFSVKSHTPYPYLHCYCEFCRSTAGSGGYAVNIMAQAKTMRVSGKKSLGIHHGMYNDDVTDELKQSPALRYFCHDCGSPLWIADPRWPQWVYPYASAVHTPLPVPPEKVHIMLDFKADWVEVPGGANHRHFARYPDESIVGWHHRQGLYIK